MAEVPEVGSLVITYRNNAFDQRALRLIEWAVADVFFKAQGDSYLGTQGDIWDAQKDIFIALFGAIVATTIVSSIKKIFKIHEST